METILFPAFNILININPIMFRIFNFDIYWYSFFIVISFVIGMILCKKNNLLYGINFNDIVQMMIFVIPISIIGARIYYVIFNLQYYINNLGEILNIRDGGLAIYGGIFFAILVVYIFCKKKKIIFLDMLDYLVPYLALGQAIGRWGNFFNVEAYGGITTSIFRMGIIENGKYIEVHPTFLYESIALMIIFVVLLKYRQKRKYSGQLVCIYFLTYSFVRIFIEELRVDSLMIFDFKVSQIISIILLIFSFIACLKKK